MRVAIIDYGSGNLHSAAKALQRAANGMKNSPEIQVTADPETVLRADRIILPGVGAFAACREGLYGISGMMDALREVIEVQARPFLGICVGMQLMATRGLEKTSTDGFNWISGEVIAIQPDDPHLPIPHMGWNTISPKIDHPVFDKIKMGPDGLHAYFVHSFHLVPDDPRHCIAASDYGGPITAMVAKDNCIGTQFHPEKSQTLGLAMIKNFLKWAP